MASEALTGKRDDNVNLMRLIDKQSSEMPFHGLHQRIWHLWDEGHLVSAKRLRRLMRLMGQIPIYQKSNTSKTAKGHIFYPYLLRGLQVDRPSQSCGTDIF